LLSRRSDAFAAAALAGAVVALDLLWGLFVGSTGHLTYGLVDEPAHLATCAIALLALAAVTAAGPPRRFAVAALISSVAIDIDHIPGILGSHALAGTLPRPYSHSLVLVAALIAVGCLSRRRDVSQISLGLAFGVSAHLLRDLATGPGIPLLWPLSSSVLTVPYAFFAVCLTLAVLAVAVKRGTRLVPRLGLGIGLSAICLGAVAIPAHATPARDAVGVYLPDAEWNPSVIDQYAGTVGRQPAIVSLYTDWSEPIFRPAALEAITARGAVPMVTWEPWRNWSEGVSLASIAAGAEDAYVAASASQAAAWGGPIFLRFGHEMNGGWYPWGVEARNSPATYRAAWRHVVEVFRAQGATNVRWVWTPYIEGDRQRPFRRYYPGGKWVDWAGFDGFNWGSRFLSFAKLFQRSYTTMVRMTKKPLIVAETGSVEYGGSKPEWIRRALDRALPRYKHIRALVWWDGVHKEKGTDIRIDTSPASFAAWSEALQAPRLDEGSEFLLTRPAWLKKSRHKHRHHHRHRRHRKRRRR
jgi:membrane-bound metal-dependent hydrolase YbcI (DUF457 family)